MAKNESITDETVYNNSKITDLTEVSRKELIARSKKFLKKFRVSSGKEFKLKNYPTSGDFDLGKVEKQASERVLQMGVEALAKMQDKLYAQDKWSLLVIFQAMDAAGKDGAIKHVMSGINPQGCQVTSFKAPSEEELDHDYLWRCMKNLPERGRIGIFNRSYYEEVLVVRVHEAFLMGQKLPEKLITENIWDDRLTDIKNFERYLNNNGILVVKIFLNVSKKEQKRRFLERIERPEKNWKFSNSDLGERKFWKQYMDCYEDLIRKTSTEKSPWYVVPADNKRFSRIVIASAILHALDSMKLAYPQVSESKRADLQSIKQQLIAEK
jgi:PPK2 family polyphosphate:nucleotide phosphotransferase